MSGPAEKAQALLDSGKFAEAARFFEAAVKAGDRTVGTRCSLACALAADGRMDGALAQLQQAARMTSNPSQICTALQRLLEVARGEEDASACMKFAAGLAHRPADRAMILGGLYFKRRMLKEAESCLREALRLDRAMTQGHLMLGRLLEEKGAFEEAEKAYAKAARLSPSMAEPCLRLAEVCLQGKRLSDAEAHAREALRRDPDLSHGYLLLGKVYERRGRLDEAEKQYQRASRTVLSSEDACVRLAEAYLRRGQTAEAEEHLRKAVAGGENSPRVFLLFVEVLAGQRRLEEAADILDEGIRRQPEWPGLHFKLGWICQQAGLPERSARAFERFLQFKAVKREDELHHRFLALIALERFEEAFAEAEKLLNGWDERVEYERLFRPWASNWLRPQPEEFFTRTLKALEDLSRRRPRSPWPRLYRGALLSYLRRTREALSVLDGLAGVPARRYGWMRFVAGVERLQTGRYLEALEDLEAVAASRPRAWWARCRLAETLLCLGREEEALAEFSRAERQLTEERQKAEVWAWKGEVLLWLGRVQESLETLGRAVAAGSWLAVCWRGEAFMLSGRLEEALADLDRAITPGSKDVEALILRGETKRRLGRLREALSDLDRAVELQGGTWALVNRALACHALKDSPGLWRDFEKVPAEVVDHAAASLGRGSWRGWRDRDVVETLERALVLAKGIRRPETYLYPVWMKPPPAAGAKTEKAGKKPRPTKKR